MHRQLHDRFHALHRADAPLLIANAWDAASAALWQRAGAPAIGTSSAALAWACGYADGGGLDRDALLQRVRDIVRVTSVPVSIDVEDGYSDSPEEVAALVREVADAGAVGINIEDGRGDPRLLAAKIECIRAALDGRPMFINARTDVYLAGMASGAAAVTMTIERLRQYAAAGADGAFVPGLSALDGIRAIASAVALPLNVMTVPGLAPPAQLQAAGVRRISAGPGLFQHTFAAGLQAARRFLDGDTVRGFDQALGYAEFNQLFAAR